MLQGLGRLHCNSADLEWGFVGDDELPGLQILQEHFATELFQASEFIHTVLHETLEHSHFFGVSVAVKQPNFSGDILSVFKLCANVSAEEYILLFIARRHAIKDDSVLGLRCVSTCP